MHPPPFPMHHYPSSHYPPPQYSSQYPPMHTYDPYAGPSSQQRLPPPLPITHVHASNKRLAPPHPAESPAKKKQSKWTPDEDASIIQLRGNGMKWEDISKHLPGRSAISCRLRFQNYLERRAEWDEERKNKLARLYERCVVPPPSINELHHLIDTTRFKKDMWEKIAKEMQLPWRAAENMHWQIGEVEMAQRANVPVFHAAGQNPIGALERTPSTSPPVATAPLQQAVQYTHTHNHSLPHIPMSQTQPPSPVDTRPRRSSGGSSPNGHPASLRRRADSARAVPTLATRSVNRPLLPPVGELAGQHLPVRYSLPPVISSGDRR